MRNKATLFTSLSAKTAKSPWVWGLLLAVAAPATWAQSGAVINGRVLGYTPINQAVPVQVCAPANTRTDGSGAVVGALAGGLIGSQLGQGNGNAAATVLGALGGAVLGNSSEAQQRAYAGAQCSTQYQNRLVGYDVTYEWAGGQHHAQTANPPGQWIRVETPTQAYAPASNPPVYAYGNPEPVVVAPAYPHVQPVVPAPITYVYPQPVVQAPVFPFALGVNLHFGHHGYGRFGYDHGDYGRHGYGWRGYGWR